jgi:hypothetical protein
MITSHTTNEMMLPVRGTPEATLSSLLLPRQRQVRPGDIIKDDSLLRRADPGLYVKTGHLSNDVTPY